jgi:hypothetical protein
MGGGGMDGGNMGEGGMVGENMGRGMGGGGMGSGSMGGGMGGGSMGGGMGGGNTGGENMSGNMNGQTPIAPSVGGSQQGGAFPTQNATRNASSGNTGRPFLEQMVKLHLIGRGARPWVHPHSTVSYIIIWVPAEYSLRKLMRDIFRGEDVEGQRPTIVEVNLDPHGVPQWTRGHTWRYHGRGVHRSLRDIGWPITQGTEDRPPVWLAFGMGDPDEAH